MTADTAVSNRKAELLADVVEHVDITQYDARPVIDAMRYPLWTSFGIGLFQCLAMIPGVSRSGATITGALLMGGDKRSAAEFSFFLAIPTMVGAFAVDFWENRKTLDMHHLDIIAVGFVVSFIVGLIVVRGLLGFVQKRGYWPFAVWRIVVGAAGLVLLVGHV